MFASVLEGASLSALYSGRSMTTLAFDSLRYARRLKEVGVPEAQAEVQAELMAEAFGFYADNIVTKDYLDARLDAALGLQSVAFERRMSELESQMNARFARQDLRINSLTVMVAAIFVATVVPALVDLLN